MSVLLIIEHDNKNFAVTNCAAYVAALQLHADIDAWIIGADCAAVVAAVQQQFAFRQILVTDAGCYAEQLPENISTLISMYIKNKPYKYILAAATTYSKNLLPRIAAELDVEMLSEVIKIIDHDTFVRPMYAGNILATVQLLAPIKIITIRHTAFAAHSIIKGNTHADRIKYINNIIENNSTKFLENIIVQTSRPELTQARIIVAGGRGFKTKENFQMLEKLADTLHAAIGASRAAVDAGWIANEYQVGQTGKVVAPELYIAIGISGAIQHLAGMKDSKIIVAINQDENSPIFAVANYKLLGDLFEILPELHAALNATCNS